MHPALSIILFTTVSGVGLGMLAWLGLGGIPGEAQSVLTVVAVALTVAGLMSSTFHLGHPERAWRALSQWRSSWLSREGVMAIVALAISAAWWLLDFPRLLGVALSIAALLTVYTTSMIYAQMKSVRQWNTGTTPVVFLLLALAGGGLACLFGNALLENVSERNAIVVAIVVIAAWSTKGQWWRRADGAIEISTAGTATGLGGIGQVRLFESPHTGGSYLLEEMGFQVGRKHARTLRRIAILAGGALPLLGIALALRWPSTAPLLIGLSLALHLLGVLAERWLFFAEARHAVVSYYGRD